MRLFEVDRGSARSALAVIQGLADKNQPGQPIPFDAVMSVLEPFALGVSDPDGLRNLLNTVDPTHDVADVDDDGRVTLATKDKKSGQQASQWTGVDTMASQGSKKLEPDISALASHGSKKLEPDI